MKNLIPVKEYILDMLRCNRFAVLATVSDDQPYASLIAVTAADGYLKLIFATYRNTRKYNNIIRNGNVSILFENRSTTNTNLPGGPSKSWMFFAKTRSTVFIMKVK